MGYPAFSDVRLSGHNVMVGGNNGPDKIVKIELVVISAKDDRKRLEFAVEGSPGKYGPQELESPWTFAIDQSDLPSPFKKKEKVIVAGIGTTNRGQKQLWAGFTAPNHTVAGSSEIQ